VAVLDISLVGNAGTQAKVLKHKGLKFLVPVKLSWTYEGNIREISINTLVDAGAKGIIFDTDFVEQMIIPCVKRET